MFRAISAFTRVLTRCGGHRFADENMRHSWSPAQALRQTTPHDPFEIGG
jgi:hypothetical protein